jgi:hypothetical protein
MKVLLSCVNEGYLWLDRPISIDADLIVCIIGLLLQGKDPASFFFDKKNEKYLTESIQ